jgi:hypothetical protein
MPTDIRRLKCFVIASPQDRRFEQLYEEIYDGAIRGAASRGTANQDAELIPCRTTFDAAAKLSMETIAQDIAYCDACFADLSQDSAYQWFAIGCALALGKPLCLVSSKNVAEDAPFALPQPGVIQYPLHALPSDYQRLRDGITNRLRLVVSQRAVAGAEGKTEIAAKTAETVVVSSRVVEESAKSADEATVTDIAAQVAETATEAVGALLELSVGDVRVHELLALTIILREQGVEGLTLRELALEMNKHGVAQATSLSIHGLCRKQLVERRLISKSNEQQSYDEERLFVSPAGQAWIDANRENLDLSFTPPPPNVEPVGLMELISSI